MLYSGVRVIEEICFVSGLLTDAVT